MILYLNIYIRFQMFRRELIGFYMMLMLTYQTQPYTFKPMKKQYLKIKIKYRLENDSIEPG